MGPICLHSKTQIESFLRRNTFLHIYSIGDLDDHFWKFTTWYGLLEGKNIKAIALVYSGVKLPVLQALSDEETPYLQELLGSIIHLLPKNLFCCMNLGLAGTLQAHYDVKSHGKHFKMALNDSSARARVDTSQVVSLSKEDLSELESFYTKAYPTHSFEPNMLDTNRYYGIRGQSGLISAAGVHVYSERYGVAALANIATHPEYRRQGYARAVVAGLCQQLQGNIQHIGLNVQADNTAARHCYKSLGFEVVGSYEEAVAELG